MTYLNNYELVRRDLLDREHRDTRDFGAPVDAYTGRAAILDAYDSAIDLACYLRRAIEDLTIGDGSHDRRRNHDVPGYGA